MLLNRTLWAGVGIVAAASMAGAARGPTEPSWASAGGTWWSSTLFGSYTHPGAFQFAASHVEYGFSDWRLPTLEELQGAVTDADPETFGQTTPNVTTLYWSSKKNGNMWGYAVEIVTDGDGYPVPNLSGRVVKLTRTSAIHVRCVRP